MREVLLKEFCKSGSRLRLLIATTAFVMGADVILHPTTLGKKVTHEMKNYKANTQVCRRRKLFEMFLFNDERKMQQG